MAQTCVTGTGSWKIRMTGALATISAGPPGHPGVGEMTVTPTRLHGAALSANPASARTGGTCCVSGDPRMRVPDLGAVFPVPGRWQTRVMAGGDGGARPGAGRGRRWETVPGG